MKKILDELMRFRDVECGMCENCILNTIAEETELTYCNLLAMVASHLYQVEEKQYKELTEK